MRTEVGRDHQSAGAANAQDVNTCQNCGALMPGEMRFCRACGCRLGEGIEEYTETVRFQKPPRTGPAGKPRSTASAGQPKTAPTGFKHWGAMARGTGQRAVKSATTNLDKWKVGRACRRVPRWVLWVFIPIFIFSMLSGPSSIRRRARNVASAGASNSYLGSHYETASGGGAFIRDITPPGSAADRAGLVGGDTIISFDGKPVKSEEDLSGLLSATPVGKTVDVTFIRDGETRTTKVTTISQEENERLEEAFYDRPEGQGRIGIDDDDAEVVRVPGTNISGVRLDDISTNLPADIAGVREGDVVIQFNDTPIRTVEELVTRIHRAAPYSIVKLVVMRGGERLEIPVKVGKR